MTERQRPTVRSANGHAHNGRRSTRAPRRKVRVSLALQGGGAHGAFTRGVLEALLDDGRVEVAGISGTSAGAMNAAAFVAGHAAGGPDGARAALAELWDGVGAKHAFSPVQMPTWAKWLGYKNLDQMPGYMAFEWMKQWLSPYQFNPGNVNPLRTLIERAVDFEAIRDKNAIRLFVSATDVQEGLAKIFRNGEVDADALLASGALPEMFHAVKKDDRYYWDGLYMANPALEPLIRECDADDIIVVQINPLHRAAVPQTPIDIMDRQNEISGNANFLHEMHEVEQTNEWLASGALDGKKAGVRPMRLHMISAAEHKEGLNLSSKMNTDPAFLRHLTELGRQAGRDWLKANARKLGKESTFHLKSRYVDDKAPHGGPYSGPPVQTAPTPKNKSVPPARPGA